MRLQIVKHPDPILRKKAEKVTEFNVELRDLISSMKKAMEKWNGVGLAAPQVGISKQIFVASTTGKATDAQSYINPSIIEEGLSYPLGEEGCLSIPDVRVLVARPKQIRIVYKDDNGIDRTHFAADLEARILCHEYDHLKGLLIIDYV